MSFFDDVLQRTDIQVRPADAALADESAPWAAPPPGWVGGWVPWHLVLVRTDNRYAVITEVSAFPSGLEFSVVARIRPESRSSFDSRMHQVRLAMHRGGSAGPRLGVAFCDGRKAALGAVGTAFRPPADRPTGPVITPLGGGGGGGDWRERFWLWPLPPPGPLTFVSAWPALGHTEQSVTADATALVAAAERAEHLWPVGPGEH